MSELGIIFAILCIAILVDPWRSAPMTPSFAAAFMAASIICGLIGAFSV